MGVIAPDVLDDELQPDGDGAWQGGQVSSRRRNLLTAGQAYRLLNVDLSKTGRPTTRRGTLNLGGLTATTPVQGMAYFDVSGTERLAW
jgi:hypothetical protein